MDEYSSEYRPLYEVKANLFKGLAHPVRVRALEVLASADTVSVADMLADTGLEASPLSVLRRHNLVVEERRASQVCCRLAYPQVAYLLNMSRALLVEILEHTQQQLASTVNLSEPTVRTTITGGSNIQVSGPTGAMVVVLGPIVATHGMGAVAVVSLMAGAIVLAAGLAELGRIVSYIPWPVIEGFMLGIAVIIFLQQVPAAVGAKPGPSSNGNLLQSLVGPAFTVAALSGVLMVTATRMVSLATLRSVIGSTQPDTAFFTLRRLAQSGGVHREELPTGCSNVSRASVTRP